MPPEQAAEIRDHHHADVQRGARIRFANDVPWWWDVRLASDRFAILTRQATFRPKGQLFYTVVDWEQGFRGPANEIGQGWGDGTFTDAECWSLMAALQDEDDFHEISWRNRAPIEIAQVRKAAT